MKISNNLALALLVSLLVAFGCQSGSQNEKSKEMIEENLLAEEE